MIYHFLKIENWKLKILAKQAGFTILESIVAIGVLSLSIAGAFSAIQQSLSSATISKEEVQAFYLAQEAVEVIKNIRDANQKAKMNNPSVTWLDNITQGVAPYYCPVGDMCTVDAGALETQKIQTCGVTTWGSCPKLKQDQITYVYGHGSGTDTNFIREIQIRNINSNQISIIVRVSWKKGIMDKEFKAKTFLFNWI